LCCHEHILHREEFTFYIIKKFWSRNLAWWRDTDLVFLGYKRRITIKIHQYPILVRTEEPRLCTILPDNRGVVARNTARGEFFFGTFPLKLINHRDMVDTSRIKSSKHHVARIP